MFPTMLTTEYTDAMHAARRDQFTALLEARAARRANRPETMRTRGGLRTGVARVLAWSRVVGRAQASVTR